MTMSDVPDETTANDVPDPKDPAIQAAQDAPAEPSAELAAPVPEPAAPEPPPADSGLPADAEGTLRSAVNEGQITPLNVNESTVRYAEFLGHPIETVRGFVQRVFEELRNR